MNRQDYLAENVELKVPRRAVADTHRTGACVAFEVVECALPQRRVGGDAVHYPRLAVVQLALVQKPAYVPVALVVVADPVQDIDCEAGVSQPCEAGSPSCESLRASPADWWLARR